MQPIFDTQEYLFNTKQPGELDAILAWMGSKEEKACFLSKSAAAAEQHSVDVGGRRMIHQMWARKS